MTTDSIGQPDLSLKAYGSALALVWFLLDQGTKWWILHAALTTHETIHVTPFFNLALGWNKGISFGMLDGYDLPPWTLALLSGVLTAGLTIWLLRTDSRLVAASLALIIGGAFGNALDRIRHGAVTDFLDFHAFGWHWPTFNIADVGIVCGVAVLVLESFVTRERGEPTN